MEKIEHTQNLSETSTNSSLKKPSKETLKSLNKSEAALIQEKIGDIEMIRQSLGLNKRKMCQLLLIDPSTWTRWANGETPVPPHIYRMLQWGLAVMDKYPEVHPLSQFASINNLQKVQELSNRITELEKKKKTRKKRAPKSQLKSKFSLFNLSSFKFKK